MGENVLQKHDGFAAARSSEVNPKMNAGSFGFTSGRTGVQRIHTSKRAKRRNIKENKEPSQWDGRNDNFLNDKRSLGRSLV